MVYFTLALWGGLHFLTRLATFNFNSDRCSFILLVVLVVVSEDVVVLNLTQIAYFPMHIARILKRPVDVEGPCR